MKFYLIVLILINFTYANNKKFLVKGVIKNKPLSINVFLKAYDTVQNIQSILDTLAVDNSGYFKGEYEYPPGIYQVDFGIQTVNFAIEKGQQVNIELTISENDEEQNQLTLNGSRDTQLVFDYDKKQKVAYKKWLHPVRRNIRLAREAGQLDKIAALSEQEKSNLIAYKNELADYAKENFEHSIALFYAAIRLDPDLHMDFLEDIAYYFNKNRPELKLTKRFNEKIERIKQTAIGSLAPQIVIEQQGRRFKLSDYRGSYVLVDFWAAWCNPCRIENLNYARLYKKYKDQGFEIFAISIDTNEKLWQIASRKDNINWLNVTDLKGWVTESAKDYNINAIPANFLVAPDGKIIARDIRGKDLQNKLAMLFKN